MHTTHANINGHFIVHQSYRENVTRRLALKQASVLRCDTVTGGVAPYVSANHSAFVFRVRQSRILALKMKSLQSDLLGP